jgi:hypothetical protein
MGKAEDLAAALDKELPTTWRPDEHGDVGATLTGTLRGWDRGTTQKYGEKDIAIIEDFDGEVWSLWLLSQVLIDEFARSRPAIGEAVAVRYEGKVDGANNTYQKWKVVAEGRLGSAEPSFYTDPEVIARNAEQDEIEEESRVMAEQVAAQAEEPEPEAEEEEVPANEDAPATLLQLAKVTKLFEKAGLGLDESIKDLTVGQAQELIETLERS